MVNTFGAHFATEMPGGAEDAATRVRDELNAAWPRGRTPASGSTPLVALAKNMSSVLQHLEAASVVTTDADDETTQVASLRAFSEREVVVDVYDRSGGATRAVREKLGAVGGTRVREARDASGDGDVGLVVVDGQEEESFEAIGKILKQSGVASTRVIVLVYGAAVGTLEEARARAARETRAPIENVFATFGILDESTSERLDSLLKNPPLRSTLETSAEVRVSVPEPVSAFALDDEDEDEGLTSIALSDAKVEREEWETIVREHAERCFEDAVDATMEQTRQFCLRRAEKLALQYEPLRSSLYQRIRGERSKTKIVEPSIQARVAPPSQYVEEMTTTRPYKLNSAASQPLGIDMIKLQSVAISGVEQGAVVASQAAEKVGSFLNWIVSENEESEDERRRRVEHERVWHERRQKLWDAERAQRVETQNRGKHSPTASFVETTSKLVDIIDGSLGGESQLDQANARIRALEAALARYDPSHELLR